MKTDWTLAVSFLASHAKDAARVLEKADPTTNAAVLARCVPQVIAETLRQLDPTEAAAVLVRMPVDQTPAILSELSLTAAARILRLCAPPELERLLAAAPEDTARALRTALSHSEGTAGAMMESKFLTLPLETSVGEARQRLRRRSTRTGNYLYLVDEEHKPVGVLSMGELMLASPKATLASLMCSSVALVPARVGVETILSHPGWRELHALPVVDSNGILVGILRRETYERLREATSERATAGESGLGLALAEIFWTLTASAVDELAQAALSDVNRRRTEDRDGE